MWGRRRFDRGLDWELRPGKSPRKSAHRTPMRWVRVLPVLLIGLGLPLGVGFLTDRHAGAGLQPPPGVEPDKAKTAKGRMVAPGGVPPQPKRIRRDPRDPAFNPGNPAPVATRAPVKIKFKMMGLDNAALAATYYPSSTGSTAPVVLMLADKGQSSHDFENKIEDLDNLGLAESLQKQGYAVLLVDLRGQGESRGVLRPADLLRPAENEPAGAGAGAAAKGDAGKKAGNAKGAGALQPGNAVDGNGPVARAPGLAGVPDAQQPAAGANDAARTARTEWLKKLADLQSVYHFLLDRHNRGEFNIGKFGVVALGETGNLALAWAVIPNAAVPNVGHPGDVSALALVSPRPVSEDIPIEKHLRILGKPLPILLFAGADDVDGAAAVNTGKPLVERNRDSRAELFPASKLQGIRLLRFETGVAKELILFLDTTLKYKTSDWEPRFNLRPVATTPGQMSPLGNAATPTPTPTPKVAPNPTPKAATKPSPKPE